MKLPSGLTSCRCLSSMTESLPIKKISAADLITERMRECILSGEWKKDEKLPSESALASLYGVNRLTVRIALQRLNALGILETKDGEGTFVRSFNFAQHMESLTDFLITPELQASITEFRCVIETECLKLTILRASRENIQQLKHHCSLFEREVNLILTENTPAQILRHFERSVEATLDFQSCICRLSGNTLLSQSFEMAKSFIRRHMLANASRRICGTDSAAGHRWITVHWELYKAIEEKHPDEARSRLLELISASDEEF